MKPTGEANKNLMDGLFDEMNRCREVLKIYEGMPAGAFCAAMVKLSIEQAELAIKENDVVAMLIAFQGLRQIELQK